MASALAPGTIVDRYRVVGTIGAGSMGDVVRGVDVDLKRAVAIKILSERHRENEELRARFVREARAVAAIAHPNVVQVFTTGTYDQRPYIAMELLDGVDLGSVVKQHGVMSSVQAARATLDGARGLEAAAKAGLIHRDVKPTNLVLLSSGVVKVTDFGLAKPLDPSLEPALTAMGVVVGTPDYIAPEQARGEAIDERVDIYALGGTLYYLCTGDPPFRTGNPAEDKYLKVVARHLKDPAPDPRAKNPGLDPEVAALCRRMLSKRPADRPGYPDLIGQLSAIIDRLQAQGSSALPPVSGASARSAPDPTPYVAGRGGPRQADLAAAARDDAADAAATLIRTDEHARPPRATPEEGRGAGAHGPYPTGPGARGYPNGSDPRGGHPAGLGAGAHGPYPTGPDPHAHPTGHGHGAPAPYPTGDGQGGYGHGGGRPGTSPADPPGGPGHEPDGGRPVMRGPAQPLLRAGDEPERRAALGRWLIAVTVVSALIFFAGLGLLLFGPRVETDGATATRPRADAGPRADAAPRAADPTPPEGMIMVRRSDGAPWLFAAKQPVSQGEYAAAHPPGAGEPAPRPLTRKQAAQPAVGVSYADAEAHARSAGMRLLTPDEWTAAAHAEGFSPAGKGLWEWVDDGTQGAQALRAVRAVPDKRDRLRPTGHANVAFRLARDL